MREVAFVPLGYKTGLHDGASVRSPPERTHAWAFAGQSTKSSRATMIKHLEHLRGTRAKHVFEDVDWDSPKNLATSTYRDLMASAKVAPCPVGWIHPDSFRLYEALECGCLPAVERPDYFADLLGDDLASRFLHVHNAWCPATDIKVIQDALDDDDAFEARRAGCAAAWAAHKARLSADVAALFAEHLQ